MSIQGFKTEMDKMNGFAKQCSVTIQITHAFRKEGQNIGGTVVPPASNSNHLVGHAIDFNIDTPRGWCDGWCMEAQTNSYAKCFTDKVIYFIYNYIIPASRLLLTKLLTGALSSMIRFMLTITWTDVTHHSGNNSTTRIKPADLLKIKPLRKQF